MKHIRIERYKHQIAEQFAGLIEGEREDGSRWIIYLDENGSPCVYFPQRDPDGAVLGDPIPLPATVYHRDPLQPGQGLVTVTVQTAGGQRFNSRSVLPPQFADHPQIVEFELERMGRELNALARQHPDPATTE